MSFITSKNKILRNSVKARLWKYSKTQNFWPQVVKLMRYFVETTYKDKEFLSNIDMGSFFCNLEIIFHQLMINDLFNEKMGKVLQSLTAVMKIFEGND